MQQVLIDKVHGSVWYLVHLISALQSLAGDEQYTVIDLGMIDSWVD